MLSGLAIYEPRTFTSLVEIASRRRSKEPIPHWWKLVPEDDQSRVYDEKCRQNQKTLMKISKKTEY